jgi:N-methylhydantoinase B
VQGTSGLPIFVGAMAFAVKAVIDKVARDGGLDPGDTYLFNDPYDGGTHLNDVRLVRPLMRDDKVFAWLASVGHWLDVGGNVPGNFNAKATESFQEGFRIPPVKLLRGGVIQQDIIDILAANSRVPQSNWGDLNGQLNALDLGERRLHALLDEYGDDTIAAALAALSQRAETLMRANIQALPDGSYRCDDFLDNDGVTDQPLAIALDLTISGDRMVLDFSRSAPPCDGPLNIARSTTVACCYVALKHLFVDVPANAGCLAPIAFVIPDTTLLGVSAPRPVGGYTETILRVIDVIFGAFAKAAPERANGSPFATINALSLAGWRQHGRRWVMFCFFGGGLGGNPETDGLNHGNNPISTATIPPLEILEALYPVMFTQWALRPDSGGAGKHRGGLGAIYEIEALADSTEVFLLGERGKYPPPGANGGGSAMLNRFVYETDAGEATPPLVSKVTDVRIRRGQKVRLETPGGGGFGDPRARDPERIARDVRLGYVTREAAERDYGVTIGADGVARA